MKVFLCVFAVLQDDGVGSSDAGPQLDLSGGRPGRRRGEWLLLSGPSGQTPVRSQFSRPLHRLRNNSARALVALSKAASDSCTLAQAREATEAGPEVTASFASDEWIAWMPQPLLFLLLPPPFVHNCAKFEGSFLNINYISALLLYYLS